MVEFDDFDTQRQCEEEYVEALRTDIVPTQKYTYFEFPTQLKWWDIDNECYIGGIGYRNEIICGCCGCLIDIEELYDDVPEGIEAIIPYPSWIDISEELKGDN